MKLDMDKIVSGKRFRIALMVVGGLAVGSLLFQAGMTVGQQKTEHAFRWNESYMENFGPGMMAELPPPPIGPMEIGGHGIVGEVIASEDDRLLIRDRDNTERSVTIDGKTIIVRCKRKIDCKDIEKTEEITVIGQPDKDGNTKAGFIRVMPKSGCWQSRRR